MIYINLLPWRAQLQAKKQREFIFYLIFYLCLTIFMCLVIHLCLTRTLANQLRSNSYLTEQINVVNQKMVDMKAIKQQKSELLKRLLLIYELQTSRIELVTMFNNFVNVLPDDIYITAIKKDNNVITLTGQARSNQTVSELMKNIDVSDSFESPVLSEIQDNNNLPTGQASTIQQLYPLSFQLHITQESNVKLNNKPLLPASNTVSSLSDSLIPSTENATIGAAL